MTEAWTPDEEAQARERLAADYPAFYWGGSNLAEAMKGDLTRALATLDTVRDVLRWYGDPVNHNQYRPNSSIEYKSRVQVDGGARARQALGEEVGGE